MLKYVFTNNCHIKNSYLIFSILLEIFAPYLKLLIIYIIDTLLTHVVFCDAKSTISCHYKLFLILSWGISFLTYI